MNDMVGYIEETIPFLKQGFLLCEEVSQEDVSVFDFIEKIIPLLREEDFYTMDHLLHFIDVYPFLYLCGCSSIASANLYENDTEAKLLGQYKVYSQIPLAKHILHGIQELNKLFSRIGSTGLLIRVGEKRFQLSAIDYFYLLIGYLYHDIAKSPIVLDVMGYAEQDYRKSDHAFFSGQYLVSIRRDLEDHGIEIPENIFLKLYIPVVSHHQRPSDTHAILLKYIDHKAREYESQKFGGIFPSLAVTEVEGQDTAEKIRRKLAIKEEVDSVWEIPDEIVHLLYKGLTLGALPKKRKYQERQQVLYVRFPPRIYVASFHVQFLLDHIARKVEEHIDILKNKEESYLVTRYVIRKFREMGYIDDSRFRDDFLLGWWYKMKFRSGNGLLFFGFPITPGESFTQDRYIVDVTPLSREEIGKYKERGGLKHSVLLKKR